LCTLISSGCFAATLSGPHVPLQGRFPPVVTGRSGQKQTFKTEIQLRWDSLQPDAADSLFTHLNKQAAPSSIQ